MKRCENCEHHELCIIPDLSKGNVPDPCELWQKEIIRCKDCYWYDLKNLGCRCEIGLVEAMPNDYCSYGKRGNENESIEN